MTHACVALSRGIQHVNTMIIITMLSQSQNSYSTNQYKEGTRDLTTFDNLHMSLGQKREDFIQSTELKGLQIDQKLI